MAYLGAAQSIEHLLSPAQQQALVEQRRAAAEQQALAAPPVPAPVLIPTAPCDGPGQAAAADEARARGGCVDVTLCDNRGRVAATSRKCWDDPVAKAALVNRIKADEIEAGALERMLEMASADGANSPESAGRVVSEAAALEFEVAEYEAQAAEDALRLDATGRARDRLRDLAQAARARLGVAP